MANATVTVESSGGDYTSLNAALSGESGDLATDCGGTGGAGILTIQCGNFADTTAASTGPGYTTSADYYINIIGDPADISAGTTGKWSTSRHRLVVSSGAALTTQAAYTRCQDLQAFSSAGHAFTSATNAGQEYQVFQRCIGWCSASANACFHSEGEGGAGTTQVSFHNCLALGDGCRYGFVAVSRRLAYALNCTAVNAQRDGFSQGYTNFTVVNCLGYHNNQAAGSYYDFGTLSPTETYSASGDTSASGTGCVTEIDDPFVDPDYTNPEDGDWHITSGADVVGVGSDLSGTFTDDIDGDTRSSWDIGADEYVAAGGGRTTKNTRPFPLGVRLGISRGIQQGWTA